MVRPSFGKNGDEAEERDVRISKSKDDSPWWNQLEFSPESSFSSSRSDSQSRRNKSRSRLKKADSPIVIDPLGADSLFYEDLTFEDDGKFGVPKGGTGNTALHPDECRDHITTRKHLNEGDLTAEDKRESTRYEPAQEKAFRNTTEEESSTTGPGPQERRVSTKISRRLDRDTVKMKLKSIKKDRLKRKARSMPNVESPVKKGPKASTKSNFLTPCYINKDDDALGRRYDQSGIDTMSPTYMKSRSEEIIGSTSLASQSTMNTFTPPCLNQKTEDMDNESVSSQGTMDTAGTFTPPFMQKKTPEGESGKSSSPTKDTTKKPDVSPEDSPIVGTFSSVNTEDSEWWNNEGQGSFVSSSSLPLFRCKCGDSPAFSASASMPLLESQSFDQPSSPDESYSVDTYHSIDRYLSVSDSQLFPSESNLVKTSDDRTGRDDSTRQVCPKSSQEICDEHAEIVESHNPIDTGSNAQPAESGQRTEPTEDSCDSCDSSSLSTLNKKKKLIPEKVSKAVPRIRVFSKTVSHSVSRSIRLRASKMKARRAARRKRDILIKSGLSVDEDLPPIAEISDENSNTSNDSESGDTLDVESLEEELLFDIQDPVTGEVEFFLM